MKDDDAECGGEDDQYTLFHHKERRRSETEISTVGGSSITDSGQANTPTLLQVTSEECEVGEGLGSYDRREWVVLSVRRRISAVVLFSWTLQELRERHCYSLNLSDVSDTDSGEHRECEFLSGVGSGFM
ncbi:hypothetical protein Tco_0556961 [Tanacetum coccineum]